MHAYDIKDFALMSYGAAEALKANGITLKPLIEALEELEEKGVDEHDTVGD